MFSLKCFAFHPKFANIRSINLVFNSIFYPNGSRPSSSLEFSTVVAFHLPSQSLTMADRMKYTWPIRSQKNFYRMNFKLQQIEILKRRNKRNDPCITDDYNFDQVFLDDYLEKVGCKAPYQRTSKNLKICDLNQT